MGLMDEMNNYNKTEEQKFSFSDKYIPKKGDSPKEVFRKIFLYIAIIGLIFSTYQLYIYLFGDPNVDKLNDSLASMYEEATATTEDVETSATTAVDEDVEPIMLSKFNELYEMNNDLVGWIEVAGTNISYPVVQNDDNSYYLEHDYNKNPSDAGTVFVDYRGPLTATETPDNIVLYAHNMASGEFFADAANYRYIDYFKEHQVIRFDTLYEESEWKVFACFLTGGSTYMDNGNFFEYHSTQFFDTQEEFDEYYNEVMKRTYYNTEVDVEFGDELLTLSTCLFSEYYDARFVVVARKVRDGESAAVDTSKTEANTDKYMTQEWLDKNT